MNDLVRSDLYRYTGKSDTISFFKCLYSEPGFRFTFFLRKAAQFSKYSLVGVFYRLFYYRYTYKYGFQIPKDIKIGKGLMIRHFGCLVVNSKAIIGDNCYLSHGVTIGQTNRGKLQGAPIIGNKVWIGTGAVLVGKITIGNNVLIAPNAYVNFDVPDNSIVVGNPAKIKASEIATEGYITNIVY